MKQVKIIFIVIFFVVLYLPMIFFNHQKNAVSEIDNKVLTENPLSANAKPVDDLTNALESFVSERIGFRDEMILGYTIVNDWLFGEMVHPSYMYGKDGYVFIKVKQNKEYGAYHDAFVNMLCEIQKYCDDRNIAFVFIYQPSKKDVLREKLPNGYNYNNDWVSIFFDKLDENGINYVDNSALLKRCTEEGIQVFNVKYDANHWNATGAFYGVNNALSKLKESNPLVHVNTIEEFIIDQELRTTLHEQVSKFPIKEYVPVFYLVDSDKIENVTDDYNDEIEIDTQHKHFSYFRNRKRLEEDAPKVLVFQGSYINGKGYKYFQNSFGEYIGVHSYNNIINFDYYVNIFKPDCIVLDCAEQAFSDSYFNSDSMSSFKLNPLLSSFDDYKTIQIDGNMELQQGTSLTQIKLYDAIDSDWAYVVINDIVFDMKKCIDEETHEIYYTVTIINDNYNAENISFILIDTKEQTKSILHIN